MNKLKDLSYKEVLELYDSIDKMNVSVVQKEEFSYHYDSLNHFLIHMRRMAFTNSDTRSERYDLTETDKCRYLFVFS